MNTGLIVILSIIGLFALYWVLWGQWKHNRMMQEADEKNEAKPSDKSE